VRFIPRPSSKTTFAGWPRAFSLAVLLILVGVARWQIRAGNHPPQEAAPVALKQQPGSPLRVAVSADGSVTVESNGKTVGFDEMARQLGGPGAKGTVELSIDARARAAAVDAALNRLRDAGVSRCSLRVEPAAAKASRPVSSRQLRADVEPDPDLETLLVEVSTQGESIRFRVGGHDAGSALELQRLLEPLARLGGPISVRTSHDGPFMHTATAIEACRDAGFTAVVLVPGGPPR
jgi:biopolymer transport protein ExbD